MYEQLPAAVVNSLDKESTMIVLNIAEGNGKFSLKDRCRFINYARDAAFRAAPRLDVVATTRPELGRKVDAGKAVLARTVSMLNA